MDAYGPISGRPELGVRGPYNWLPPAVWRTRFTSLKDDFANDGPLAQEFTRVREIAERSDWQAQEATCALVMAHPDLFALAEEYRHKPNQGTAAWWAGLTKQAGFHLAWSIVCSTTIPRTDIFTDDIPPYRSEYRRRENRFSSRTTKGHERVQDILRLLREGKTHKQIARLLGMTPGHLFSEIARLRRGGVRLSCASEQTWRSRLRREIHKGNAGWVTAENTGSQPRPAAPTATVTQKCMWCDAQFTGAPDEGRAWSMEHRETAHAKG